MTVPTGSWATWGSALVSDANGRAGAMAGRISILSGEGVVAPAFTVRITAGDSATLHLALEHAPAGSVLVVDGGGQTDQAVWGEILTRAAVARGVQGLVVDGAVRDLAALRRLNFPVFAIGATPAGPHKAGGGAWGVPVACGGVVARTGDLVVGDLDGVTVVEAEALHDVARRAAAKVRAEQKIVTEIDKGGTTAVLLGLREPTVQRTAGSIVPEIRS